MTEQLNIAEPDVFEIDLKKFFNALKRGLKWLILTHLVFGIIAIIYVLFIAKPIYTSEAKILLAGSKSTNSSLMGLANQFGFSIPTGSSEITYLSAENFPEVLKSRKLTKSILFSKFKSKEFDKPTPYFDIIFDKSDIAESDSNKLIALGLQHIANDVIGVKQAKNTNIFHILANSPEPNLSSQIASKIILELEMLQSDFSKRELSDQKKFVFGRLQEIEDELFNAETRLETFRERNLQINLAPSLLLRPERLERDIEIQTQIYISLKQQYIFDLINRH